MTKLRMRPTGDGGVKILDAEGNDSEELVLRNDGRFVVKKGNDEYGVAVPVSIGGNIASTYLESNEYVTLDRFEAPRNGELTVLVAGVSDENLNSSDLEMQVRVNGGVRDRFSDLEVAETFTDELAEIDVDAGDRVEVRIVNTGGAQTVNGRFQGTFQ